MFTGIVECTAVIESTRVVAGGMRLRVGGFPWAGQCKEGDSVSVSGVCLTVATIGNRSLEFDVIKETLDKTTLGAKSSGDTVNLERCLRVGDRLDGHFVQGHIDGTASVTEVRSTSAEWVTWLAPEQQLLPYLIPKGSISIDGVSLTIAALRDGAFSVALIPTTLERTTLVSLRIGDRVNVESDIVARTIVHRLESMSSSGVSIDTLRSAGFV